MTVDNKKHIEEEYAYLYQHILPPIKPWLDDEDVIEISLNEKNPHKDFDTIWVERKGQAGFEKHEIEPIDFEFLAERVAGATNQLVNEENPILSATLPSSERIQIVMSPAALKGGAFSIRKQTVHNLTIADYIKAGAFDKTKATTQLEENPARTRLRQLLVEKKWEEFLRSAVENKMNIVICGGTSSGKTTFFNALAKYIPSHERLITIEDAAELNLEQENIVSLISSKGDQGTSNVTIHDLLEATLRLSPDRIMLGELRGTEAFSFLTAINTGHPGSITTVHADSPRKALDRIALMIMRDGMDLRRQEVLSLLRSMIDVIIPVARIGGQVNFPDIYLVEKEF